MKIQKGDLKFVILLHLLLLGYSCGTICSKKAASYPFLSLGFLFFYGMVLLIMVLYAFAWQQILKNMSLITAYANKAITVIWGLVWGYFIFDEKVNYNNIIGAVIIMAGVYFVVTGEDDDD